MSLKRPREASCSPEICPPEDLALATEDIVTDPYHLTLPAWIDAEMKRRLHRFLDYTADTHFLYYVSQLTPLREWGSGTCQRFLCDTNSNTPLRMWIVGSVESATLTASSADPRSKFSLALNFLREVDKAAVGSLLHLSCPRPWYDGNTFEVSRTPMSSNKAATFTAVFDATETYTSKHTMPRLSPADLVCDDVVLVEFFCHRWRRTRMRTSSRWSSWYTGFQLESVSLLARAPRVHYPQTIDTFTGHM